MSTRRAIILATTLLFVALFQWWFLGLSYANYSSMASSGGLTDLYLEALLKGHSYLPLRGESESISQGERYQILDASYFGSHVYLYFGITPFVITLIPWHLLNGTYLSDSACIFGFTEIGYLFYGLSLWLLFRSERRPLMDFLLAPAFLLTVACSGTWALMARPAIYEVEGACAYACFAGSITSLVAFTCARTNNRFFLMGAALFAGLAMGCRPNFLPAILLIGASIGWLSWDSKRTASANVLAFLFSCIPLLTVGILLATWNYERFGNILEFGYHYTGFAVYNPLLISLHADNVLYNLHRYLFGAFRFGHYFPFIEGISAGPFPLPLRTHEPDTEVYGCMILFPALLYITFSFLKHRALSCLLLFCAAGNLAYLSGLGFATYRYPPDFLGALAFAAAVGICNMPSYSSISGRLLSMGILISVFLWSLSLSICEATSIATITNLFDQRRPHDFRVLSTPFNETAFIVEHVLDTGPRSIRLKLIFPHSKYGNVEPIAVIGDAGSQDFVYLYYEGTNSVQVGLESSGNGGPVSAPLSIDYKKPHTIDISLGSFLPPDDHSLLTKMPSSEISFARNYVHIAIDGQFVLDGSAPLHPTRGRIIIGMSPDDSAFGRQFTGEILNVQRPLLSQTGVFPKWDSQQFGPLQILLKLKPMPIGTRQPLVSVGYRPKGGVLFLESLAFGEVRFGWGQYNQDPIYSEAVNWDYQRAHRIEFTAGSLLPPTESSIWSPRKADGQRENMKLVFGVALDGYELWQRTQSIPDASPASVLVGRNGLTESGIAGALNAEIISVARGAW